VSAVFEGEGTDQLQGNYTNTYALWTPLLEQQRASVSTGNYFWPKHPILAGIGNISDISGILYRIATGWPTPVNGTYLIGDWTDGTPLVAVRDRVGPSGGNRVHLGFWPIPGEDQSGNYPWDGSSPTGTAVKTITIQALQYVINNVAYLQPNQVKLPCFSTTTFSPNITAAFDGEPISFGFDGVDVVIQSPPASTPLTLGTYTVHYTVHNQFQWPISGQTSIVASACPPATTQSSTKTTSTTSNSSPASRPFSFLVDLLFGV